MAWGDRDEKAVAAKLRALADRIEASTHGCITLNDFGDIFGNEFWNLIYYDFDHGPQLTRIGDILDKIERKL